MKSKRNQKMSRMVGEALRNLRDTHGSTPKEIMKYIMAEYNASERKIQRELNTALKRGVEYGILKKNGNGYRLNNEAQIARQKAIAAPQDSGCKMKKKKKSMSCKPKRKACRPKKKSKSACPMKRKKKDKCNVCAPDGCDPNARIVAVDDDAPVVPRSRSQSRARSRSQSAHRSQYSAASEPADDSENDSNA